MKIVCGRVRVGAAILFCVAFGAVLTAAPAGAAVTHDFIGTVAEGEVSKPTGLAVDSATGDLYVADSSAGALLRFAPDGTPAPFSSSGENAIRQLQIAARDQTPVAVDNSGGAKAGDFYVASGTAVRAYTPAGAPAPFADPSSYAVGNTLTGTPSGSFTEVDCLTVDSNGYVYVCHGAEVAVFTPDGESVNNAFTSVASGLAGDPNGVLYEASAEYTITSSFVPTEYPVTPATNFAGPNYLPVSFPTGIATDARNGEVFVDAGKEVRELTPYATAESGEPSNQPVTSFGAIQLAAGEGGAIAVDGSAGATAGDVYVVSGGAIDRFGPLVKAPDVETRPATAVDSGARSATLNGTVDPLGEEVTECVFEYGTGATLSQTAPCAESSTTIGEGTSPVAVHADVSGLEVADYRFRLRAAGPQGYLIGSSLAFSIVGPPAVEAESAEAGIAEAKLRATLRSGNQASSYHFEYGTTSAYGLSTPTGTLPASSAPKGVAINIANLAPGTTYHYRVVVSNPGGTIPGPDQTFTTGVPGGAGSCPNEALRVGPSAALPECRAYELVSPADKAGGEVYPSYNDQPAFGGSALAFLSTTAFAGTQADNLVSTYISTRSEAGGGSWATVGTDPRSYNEDSLLEISTSAYDANLDRGLQVSRYALAPGAIELGTNVYVHDFATGATETVFALPGTAHFQELTSRPTIFEGGTSNWSNMLFSTAYTLNSEAPEGAQEVYSWSGGRLRVISRPGGEVAQSGVNYARTSRDGLDAYFTDNADGALYVSGPDGETTLISHRHSGGATAEAEPQPANFGAASADGSVVYFIALEGLVPGGVERESPSQTLYRWERAGDRLTEVTAVPGPVTSGGPNVGSVAGTSEDGSYVYFSANAPLAEGASPAYEGNTNLYAWHAGRFQLIGQTDPNQAEIQAQIGADLISPSGRYYAFNSFSHLTPEVVGDPTCGFFGSSPCSQVFVFDSATGKLACATCDGQALGDSTVAGLLAGAVRSSNEIPAVFDDGTVYLETPNPLAPSDSNRQLDVYQWRAGQARLISTGTSGAESLYSGASADQRNVYIRTKQPLVAIDTDQRFDVYDARVEGGIAAQNAATGGGSCGESCRGASPLPPPRAATPVENAGEVCRPFGEAARGAQHRVAQLKQRLRQASGRGAAKLRHRIGVGRKQAQRLRTRADKCRRQGR